MPILLLVNKPFKMLCQFTDDTGRGTLADIIDTQRYPKYYAAGRLDYDSEGLVALTNNGNLQNQLANPQFKMAKTYWVQVEGEPNPLAVNALAQGLTLKDGPTRACTAKVIAEPNIWQRTPPIRERKNSPTHWLEITLKEGRNRQIRRMTAAVGLPTLRLIRAQIGPWHLDDLKPGQSREVAVNTVQNQTGSRTVANKISKSFKPTSSLSAKSAKALKSRTKNPKSKTPKTKNTKLKT